MLCYEIDVLAITIDAEAGLFYTAVESAIS